ncbi:hypothetical protein [Bradyrhizobium sp.]|uniref:hypothetical protein n=1 Tax=Bradyrhizobium sp. TaxID=376 RepID=UPI004037F743
MNILGRVWVFVLVLAAAAAIALAIRQPDFRWSTGSVMIGDLLREPAKYDGRSVRVTGIVADRMGIMGFGGFRLRDPLNGDEIAVVVPGGGMPDKGSAILVSGKFRQAFAIGKVSGAMIIRDR